MTATIHRINVKQIREAFEDLKDKKEELEDAKAIKSPIDIKRLNRRIKEIRRLIFLNTQTYYKLG